MATGSRKTQRCKHKPLAAIIGVSRCGLALTLTLVLACAKYCVPPAVQVPVPVVCAVPGEAGAEDGGGAGHAAHARGRVVGARRPQLLAGPGRQLRHRRRAVRAGCVTVPSAKIMCWSGYRGTGHKDMWSVLGVLNYLPALVDNSGIVAELSAPGMSCCIETIIKCESGYRSIGHTAVCLVFRILATSRPYWHLSRAVRTERGSDMQQTVPE